MSVKTELQNFAQEIGLRFDEEAKLLYGRVGGHNVCVYTIDPNTYRMHIAFSVSRMGEALKDDDLKALIKGSKNMLSYEQRGKRVVIDTAGGVGMKKTYGKAKLAIEEMVTFLNSKGYTDCCEQCDADSGMSAYYINEAGHYLCDSCYQNITEHMSRNKEEISKKKGNLIAGIVGALLGSVIGVAAIVIIGQLGYVAAISGIVMGVCTLKGYELLGGKLDKVGIVFSCLLMLLMVYVGNNLDWALAVVDAFEGVGILEAFSAVPMLVAEDVIPMSDYWMNMAMVYIFTIVGVFPIVKNAAKVKSGHYTARPAA